MKKKKIYVIAGITLLIILFRFLMLLPVKHAISYKEAKRMIENNDNYYIVFDRGCMQLSYYVITDGELKGKSVIIEPSLEEELSISFLYAVRNAFLLKAKSIEKYTDKQFDAEECPIDYKIVMEDWEIIAPIDRQYGYVVHARFNPPENHIDLLDVLFGDYKPKSLRNWIS
ncbi:MAG: hypothetical protein Q4D65_04310 [Peptostreptococcaceae bacterium]|nr:hypothetical protein [Peptostreptococcaceae bacterium]